MALPLKRVAVQHWGGGASDSHVIGRAGISADAPPDNVELVHVVTVRRRRHLKLLWVRLQQLGSGQLLALVPGAAQDAALTALALGKQLGPAHGYQGEGEYAPGGPARI